MDGRFNPMFKKPGVGWVRWPTRLPSIVSTCSQRVRTGNLMRVTTGGVDKFHGATRPELIGKHSKDTTVRYFGRQGKEAFESWNRVKLGA